MGLDNSDERRAVPVEEVAEVLGVHALGYARTDDGHDANEEGRGGGHGTLTPAFRLRAEVPLPEATEQFASHRPSRCGS